MAARYTYNNRGRPRCQRTTSGCMIYKFVLVGDFGVGKSALFQRLKDGSYQSNFESTIDSNVDSCTKCLRLGNGEKVFLQIWDTGGAERYRTITKNYYNYAHVVLLVYDLTAIHSLHNLAMWLQEARSFAPNAVPVMIGNKADLPPDMDSDIPDSFATSNDINLHFKVSVKENRGIHDALEAIATFLHCTLEEEEDDPNWDIVTLDFSESQGSPVSRRTPCFGLCTRLWRKLNRSPQYRDIDPT